MSVRVSGEGREQSPIALVVFRGKRVETNRELMAAAHLVLVEVVEEGLHVPQLGCLQAVEPLLSVLDPKAQLPTRLLVLLQLLLLFLQVPQTRV